MRKVYFDTSAYVKIYTQEAGTDLAELIFSLAEEGRVKIIMSVWAVNETIAAIDRTHRRRIITDLQRDRIFATILKRTIEYAEKPDGPVDFIPIDRRLLSLSKDVIIGYHVSADDALHLSTAYATDCECFIFKDDKLRNTTGRNVSGMRLPDITSHAEMNPLMKSLDV
ncbi:MAG TPA: type II toxin-antitoxin system VapC family toxin [Nitrososphaera sp.]